jgi:hypothetical protein
MIILFGTRTSPTVMGQLAFACTRCGQHVPHQFVRTRQWFTLFFIPVIPLGTNTYATCGHCRFRQTVNNAQADSAFAQQRMMGAAGASGQAYGQPGYGQAPPGYAPPGPPRS